MCRVYIYTGLAAENDAHSRSDIYTRQQQAQRPRPTRSLAVYIPLGAYIHTIHTYGGTPSLLGATQQGPRVGGCVFASVRHVREGLRADAEAW